MPRLPRLRPVTLAAVLALALAAPAALSSAAEGPPAGGDVSEYSLLHMNVCLSGYAGCFAHTAYPAVVDEAIANIRAAQPDAVTLNEACSGDVERIARETGYDYRFATVIYRGGPLSCRNPVGRGVFGIAVLTKDAAIASESAPYKAQLGVEERRWLCVETDGGTRVCTSHLSVSGSPAQAATNEAQCHELTAVLTADDGRATLFGGDVNRQGSCAPAHAWTERDDEAAQAPGIQHVYGTRPGFVRPRDEIVPMTYSDHDALLVRALRIGPS